MEKIKLVQVILKNGEKLEYVCSYIEYDVEAIYLTLKDSQFNKAEVTFYQHNIAGFLVAEDPIEKEETNEG